jgi:hypothetical protein
MTTGQLFGEGHPDLAQLRLYRSDLEDDIGELRSFLGPWYPSRIPFEILSQIFIYASTSCIPWKLMGVCRAWRRAATQCCPLWSTLCIESHKYPQTRHRCGQFHPTYRVLNTPIAVRKAIRRSRGGLLDVQFVLHPGKNNCMGCFRKCLGVVGGPNLERWRSLSFDIAESAQIDLGPMLTGSLSNLHSVCFQSYSLPLIAAVSSSAPLLRTVAFSGIYTHDFARYIGQKFWPQTRKLKLETAWCGGYTQCEDLSRLLTSCTTLHSIELDTSYMVLPPPLHPLWPPHIPSLERVKCKLHLQAWHLLSGMAMTVLHIKIPSSGGPDRGDACRISKIFLPNLKRLICEGSDATLCASRLFDAPSLVDLALFMPFMIYFQALGDTMGGDVWTNWSNHLRTISLHIRSIWPKRKLDTLLLLLHRHCGIQYLTLRGIPLDVEIFALPDTQALCPRLISITWWLVPITDHVEEVQKRFYEHARRCIGGPHTSWRIERISEHDNLQSFINELDWD